MTQRISWVNVAWIVLAAYLGLALYVFWILGFSKLSLPF